MAGVNIAILVGFSMLTCNLFRKSPKDYFVDKMKILMREFSSLTVHISDRGQASEIKVMCLSMISVSDTLIHT